MCLSLMKDKDTLEAVLNSEFEVMQLHSDICFVNYIPHMVYRSNWLDKCIDSHNRSRVREVLNKALRGPADKPYLVKTDIRCPEGRHKFVHLVIKPCRQQGRTYLHLKAREHFLAR